MIASIRGYFNSDKYYAEWCNCEISPAHCDAFCVSYYFKRDDDASTMKDLFFSSLAEAMLWCELHEFEYNSNEDHISLVAADSHWFNRQTYATVGTPQ